jgi:sugar lactone lactonase YvrE
LLGIIPTPEVVSNREFGGAERRDLYITATTSQYQVSCLTRGAVIRPAIRTRTGSARQQAEAQSRTAFAE